MTSNDSRTGGLALRYATAVFELAAEERAIDSLAADSLAEALLNRAPTPRWSVRVVFRARTRQAYAVLKEPFRALARKLVRCWRRSAAVRARPM